MTNADSNQADAGVWLAIRRPLLVAFLLGCATSLMTSGRLSLRLAGPGTLYWTFVPALEIAGLWAVSRRRTAAIPFSRAVDSFFRGHGPWLWWMALFAAIWAVFPAPRVYAWVEYKWAWYGTAAAAFVWSAAIDYRYLRDVGQMSRGAAGRSIVWMRMISWGLGLAWFAWPAGWQTVAARFGL